MRSKGGGGVSTEASRLGETGGGLVEMMFAPVGILEGGSVGPGDIGKETTSGGYTKSTLINRKCWWV